mmetsp:Transcript_63245/g.124208  ORF Transcript_63245/g.124208 Transcript_63245/m.124208 type:complete len:297 (+) Transcript_63245:124-1014(+)
MLPVASHMASLTNGRIALVTGANKGIGKEIVRELAADPEWTVLMGCRSMERGRAAAAELEADGRCRGTLVPVHIDLAEAATIEAAHAFVDRNYGRLDCLVNNAAVCFNDPTLYGQVPHTPFEAQASVTVETNFFGTLKLTHALTPLLRRSESPRIVNIASYAGRLAILRNSPAKLATFTKPDLTLPELEAEMRRFVSDVEAGTHAREGWPNTCYGMSKLGLIAWTQLTARLEPTLMANTVDPGYCATDQNRHQGSVSAAQGARTPVWLARLGVEGAMPPSSFVSGKYFRDGAEVEW